MYAIVKCLMDLQPKCKGCVTLCRANKYIVTYYLESRMITGCYHDVSDEHLQSYIDEACFRWNTRKMAESERFSHMFHSSIGLVKPNREFVLYEVA